MFDDYDFDEDDDDDEADDDDFDDEADDKRHAPKRDNSLKLALGLVVFLAVVAVAAMALVVFGGGGAGTPGRDEAEPGRTAEIASADDTGPVGVIIADPTCTSWTTINDTLSSAGEGKWNDRDRSIPAAEWTPELQQMHMGAAAVLRSAAAQAVGLAKLTPHRVMRELYEQFIAYGRAYAEKVPQYTPADNNLAEAANSAASALGAICRAIDDGSAASRGPLAPIQGPPELTATPADPTNPVPFLAGANPVCRDWHTALRDYMAKTTDWQQMDPNLAAILWNPQQKAVNVAAAQVMSTHANNIEQLGRNSGNATLQDFAILIAQYQRAFVAAMMTYTPADQHLANAAAFTSALVDSACTISGA
ncbi:hypothetical protein [Mycobacterium sp. 1274756.6]|uniref:hypothetical protein n=1 Tax=Mycobacterium sp. 1274756.6 TaxID=1834076 RepID=UPI0009ED9545|nr:hypothetical protein [Mycobacterium sp. 1274756.6]